MDDYLSENCECCGDDTPIDYLHIVCPECLHAIRNVKQKEELFKMDWEGEDIVKA